jgi:hypothetical protein
MAIAVGSTSNTPTYGTRTNSTIVAPSGIANGNLLVAVLHVGDASALPALAITPPAGWTEVTNSPAAQAKADPYTIAIHIFYKVASGESGNYTFSHSTAETEGFMYRLTGTHATTPIDVAPGAMAATIVGGAGVENGKTTNYASVTTVTDGASLLFAESVWDAPGAGTISGSTPTIAVRRTGTISLISDGTQTTAGATVLRTRTNGNVNNDSPWASLVVAIRPSGGGGVAYSLTAETGVLATSGQANRLARSRDMDAAQGTLTLSGQTTALRGARKTAAGLGTLTLSGQANRLARSRLFPAGLGTLTLAGPVVNLIKSGGGPKTLPAGLGFPLLGGQQAILRYARKMPALTGTLTASGKPVVLTYVAFEGDIVMPASAGVLMMSGRDASLNVRRAAQDVGKLEFGRKVYLRRW